MPPQTLKRISRFPGCHFEARPAEEAKMTETAPPDPETHFSFSGV